MEERLSTTPSLYDSSLGVHKRRIKKEERGGRERKEEAGNVVRGLACLLPYQPFSKFYVCKTLAASP